MDKLDALSNDLRILHFHEKGAGLLAEDLIELGYRKIEGAELLFEPPLLNMGEFLAWLEDNNIGGWNYRSGELNREAQRDSDIKWHIKLFREG